MSQRPRAENLEKYSEDSDGREKLETWKSNPKIVMDEELVQNIVMDEELVQNGVLDAKIREKTL